MLPSTAAGLALGALADLALGDPRRGHPVAGFGTLAAALERRVWRDSRAVGAGYAAALAGAAVAAGRGVDRLTRGHPLARTAATAVATWTVLGGTSLGRAATTLQACLDDGDLPAARAALPALAGRDPRDLDAAELARATVESVAENTSDAAVAPLFWGAVAGVPGLLGYRAVNTLDAMVGYRSPRHLRFGWAAARADDVANWLPARLTAAADRRVRAPGRRLGRPGRSARGAATGPRTRARTPAAARPPSPGRWDSGWAGATSTAAGSSCGRSSATGARPGPPTWAGRCGCPGRSGSPRRPPRSPEPAHGPSGRARTHGERRDLRRHDMLGHPGPPRRGPGVRRCTGPPGVVGSLRLVRPVPIRNRC